MGVGVGAPDNALKPPDATQKVDGIILLWDANTGELKQKLPMIDATPGDLVFSPDGHTFASDGDEAGVTFWNTITGTEIRTLDEDRPPPLQPSERRMSLHIGNPEGNATLAFAGDGTRLARSRKGTVKLWDAITGALLGTITDPENTQNSETNLLALSPNGKILATANREQGLKLWEVATRRLLWKSPERSGVSIMEMAPNGRTLATSSGGDIRLWGISQAAQGIVK